MKKIITCFIFTSLLFVIPIFFVPLDQFELYRYMNAVDLLTLPLSFHRLTAYSQLSIQKEYIYFYHLSIICFRFVGSFVQNFIVISNWKTNKKKMVKKIFILNVIFYVVICLFDAFIPMELS